MSVSKKNESAADDGKRLSFNRERKYIVDTLIRVLIPVLWLFIIYSSYTPKHSIAPLPGVKVSISNDLIVVGGQSRKFDWKEYGLIIDVPSDALPHGFLADITIRVSFCGPYIYPGLENWKPASPVYWVSSSREFINPIMFGIRHYVRGEVNSSVIKVVTADDSPQNVSYVFQEIPSNITVSKDYVYFSMSHFSGIRNVRNETVIESNFCGTLFSRDSPKGKNMWDYNFVVYQCSNTIDIKTQIDKQTNSSWSVEKAPTIVVFLNGSTELELNLTIDPPMLNWQATGEYEPLRYRKKTLQDELIISNMQFTLRWVGKDTSPTVAYDLSFSLKGAEQPEKIYIITKSIEQPSIWEKYKMIIMTTALILTLSLILVIIYLCPDYREKAIGYFVTLLTNLAVVILLSLLNFNFGDSIAKIFYDLLSKQK